MDKEAKTINMADKAKEAVGGSKEIADEKELQKIRFEHEQRIKKYIAERKKALKQDLELLRLEHELVKLQVEHYQYSLELQKIKEHEDKKAKEEQLKTEAAKSAEKTAGEKIIKPHGGSLNKKEK